MCIALNDWYTQLTVSLHTNPHEKDCLKNIGLLTQPWCDRLSKVFSAFICCKYFRSYRVILLSLHRSRESIYETQYNSLAEYEWVQMSVSSHEKVKGHVKKNAREHFINNFAWKGYTQEHSLGINK